MVYPQGVWGELINEDQTQYGILNTIIKNNINMLRYTHMKEDSVTIS